MHLRSDVSRDESAWRSLTASQQPGWSARPELDTVLEQLRKLPPLVFAGEARLLETRLASAAEGRAFVIQAGDCAESFHDFSGPAIRDRLKILLQMSAVLTWGAALPVVKIARMAGQFAKPRSAEVEELGDGRRLPVFRGHMVNSEEESEEAREADPARMLAAYHQSASTLNLLRAFTKGGFADLAEVHSWNRAFVASSPQGARYEQMAADIDHALRFMAACGVDLSQESSLQQVDLWTSHEGLILEYEAALTRTDSLTGGRYACSGHYLWIGERTRSLDEAHVAFMKGIGNPIGVKVGPNATGEEVVRLCEELDPDRRPGRLTLIIRMGADRIGDALPAIVAAVQANGHPVVWVSDPMHGNVFKTPSGVKTRHVDAILREFDAFVAICRSHGAWPGGIHLEYTADDVTECLGGSTDVREDDLSLRYRTLCDPRLNGRQALDVAFHVAALLRQG